MSKLLAQVIHDIQFLPGIGEKTAQRLIHHIFSRDKQKAHIFANSLLEALEHIKYCRICRNLSEDDVCHICTSQSRDTKSICVVEHPSNVDLIEQTQTFQGLYFVLHGALSPIDGISPEKLGIQALDNMVQTFEAQELIVATSTRIEGEATAYYLSDQFSHKIKVTRLAHGMPLGGSLDFIDSQTLARALNTRHTLDDE